MTRLQIPAYSDHWMRDDRYGTVVSDYVSPGIKDKHGDPVTMVRVTLDKSGKRATFILDDCQEV